MRPLPMSDAGFPMAPSQTDWDALSPEERAETYDAIPNEVTDAEMSPPEGDQHFLAKTGAMGALRGFFTSQKRRVYLAAELPVYYPAAPRFAPDLLVVFDVGDHARSKWVVSHEGKGLDWVLEVHFGGDRKKDAERNVKRYAGLGIPEYFLYDRARGRLYAYRLEPGATAYLPIVPQQGRYTSAVLGLEVEVERERLRFWNGTAMLFEMEELVVRLQSMLDAAVDKADEEARLRAEAQREIERLRAELAKRDGE